MPRAGLAKEQVFEVARELEEAGTPVTAVRVRDLLGLGPSRPSVPTCGSGGRGLSRRPSKRLPT